MAKPKKAELSPSRAAILVHKLTKDEDPDKAIARTLTRPESLAGAVIQQFDGGNHGIKALVEELALQIEAVNRGDLSRPEAMLFAQAHTLSELFTSLARRAAAVEYLNQYETYMRFALKAQSQCRATLEALAEMKNPRPVAFVRQGFDLWQ